MIFAVEATARTGPVRAPHAQDQNGGYEESVGSQAYPLYKACGQLAVCIRGTSRRYTVGSLGGRDSQPLVAG